MGTEERGTTRPVFASANMETNGDAMKLFIGIALVSLAMIAIATATVLHTWFKYDAPKEDGQNNE